MFLKRYYQIEQDLLLKMNLLMPIGSISYFSNLNREKNEFSDAWVVKVRDPTPSEKIGGLYSPYIGHTSPRISNHNT